MPPGSASACSAAAASRPTQFGALLLETALAVVAVGGLEAVAFGLLPLRFLSGAAVYGWSRLAWALLFGISVFAFVHLLVGPHTGYLSDLSPAALIAALGAFAAFGAFSLLFWGYFRFRPAQGQPGRLGTPAKARRMAWTDASASASVVDQLLTLMRIAALPFQLCAAHPGGAIGLHAGDHLARPRVVAEANEHLVEHDLVQHLDATGGQLLGHAARKAAAALDQLAHPAPAQRADGGVEGEAASPA